MAILSPNLNVMTAAAQKAARRLARDFGEVENLQISVKGTADFVSAADLKAETILKEELSEARPDYGFVLEEGGTENEDAKFRFIIDPLDGTTNFLHGNPNFAISIALAEGTDLRAAVIYDLIRDEMFYAEKGNGAFVSGPHGDRRLRVSSRRRMEDSIIATSIPHMGYGAQPGFLQEMNQIMTHTAGIRASGSCALNLAHVAAGRLDAYWAHDQQIWDLAAGILLVREAGGFAGSHDGRTDTARLFKKKEIMATNGELQTPLEKALKQAKKYTA